MHLLTQLTKEWFSKRRDNNIYFMDWISWESEVLLPWMEEKKTSYTKDGKSIEVFGEVYWGTKKRREQAEWLKNQPLEIQLSDNYGTRKENNLRSQKQWIKNIDTAFGLEPEEKSFCEKCGQEVKHDS